MRVGAVPRSIGVMVLMTIAAACASPESPRSSSGPSPLVPSPASTALGDAFAVNGDEALAISIVERFIESINAADLDAATALIAEDATASDCDYAHQTVAQFNGKAGVGQWLSARIADHEQLTIGRIFNASPIFDHVVGVGFANRSNDTLTRLGFRDGVVPSVVAKVVLTPTLTRIGAFAFGPGGADPATIRNVCTPA